jgi:hypothetical protein
MARPISLWGDPDSPTFAHDYLDTVMFMGKRLTWHKWAEAPLMEVQADILASGVVYHWDDLQTYCNRNIAGTHTKSNHSWALAVDINPRQNPQQKPLKTDLPPAVIAAFRAHGFKWGGDYSDAMHFEYLGEPVKEVADMTKAQNDLLVKTQEGVAKLGYTIAINNALQIGDTPTASRLNSEFYTRWPKGQSGLPPGWPS